ncbi:MAG: hypothetical protein FWD57_05505 [Polyangiaceae bacterium]|nr:hypothetical protein [Polyangiaceae bacterium]
MIISAQLGSAPNELGAYITRYALGRIAFARKAPATHQPHSVHPNLVLYNATSISNYSKENPYKSK